MTWVHARVTVGLGLSRLARWVFPQLERSCGVCGGKRWVDCLHCDYCGLDIDAVGHLVACPEVTGCYPVRPADLWPDGLRCGACDTAFRVGDAYTVRVVCGTHGFDQFEVVCLGCGAEGVAL